MNGSLVVIDDFNVFRASLSPAEAQVLSVHILMGDVSVRPSHMVRMAHHMASWINRTGSMV